MKAEGRGMLRDTPEEATEEGGQEVRSRRWPGPVWQAHSQGEAWRFLQVQ